MKINFVKPDLHQFDRVSADTFVVSLFEEEKPPHGVAGLVDWRLCGRLSRLIASGKITARFREATLLPAYGRLPVQRICVYGLGRRAEFTPARAREATWYIADSLHRLRADTFLCALPGSPLTDVPLRNRMEIFLEEIVRVFGPDDSATGTEAFVAEPSGAHRELIEVVSAATRRLRAVWK